MTASAAAAQQPVLAETPTQLLDMAGHLFAERGADNVSIREIVRASGQGAQ